MLALLLLSGNRVAWSQTTSWPDLSRPARAIGGGEHDAAVVIGVENYFVVPPVPGAKSNADEWYEYLTTTRKVPPQNVKLLTDTDATRERIIESARKAAGEADKDGTLWFIFIGHGAPSVDGKDGLLVGVDAQQQAESLQERSARRGEVLKALAASTAGSIRVILDACFSGRSMDGTSLVPGLQPLVSVASSEPLDARIAVLTAAKSNQFAGALPGSNRPAFSYLVLGGLRGWAAEKDGRVTTGSLWRYAKNALAATLRGRDQTPDLIGSENALVAISAGEAGPNLATLAEVTAGTAPTKRQFRTTGPIHSQTVPVASHGPAKMAESSVSPFTGVDLSKFPNQTGQLPPIAASRPQAQQATKIPSDDLFAEAEKDHPIAAKFIEDPSQQANDDSSRDIFGDWKHGPRTFHVMHLIEAALIVAVGFWAFARVGRVIGERWRTNRKS